MKGRKHRGLSLGTVTMLLLTAAVLAGFCLLLPSFTGSKDILIDAAELVVAIDNSFSQFSSSAGDLFPTAARPSPSAPQLVLATATPAPAASQPTAPPVTPVPQKSFSFCAAGNIVLNSRTVSELSDGKVYRFDILTDQITGLLEADLSIATLENLVMDSAKVSNLNMPSQLLSAIRSAGVNTLSLAHTDVFGSGLSGALETRSAIEEAGMSAFGVFRSESERSKPEIQTISGVKVALLSYMDDGVLASRRKLSKEEQAFAYAPADPAAIMADLEAARTAGAEVCVVFLCWGKEGSAAPTDEQTALAQQLADAGADIILGSHSGVLQPVQMLSADRGDGKYHPVLCAYSLGNLFSHDRNYRTSLASILLKTEVVYDSASGCVAFDGLNWTPMYAWRGTDEGKTRQRILINDPDVFPAFVDAKQQGVMQRCTTLVNEVMDGTGISKAP